jgi:hypothetical protein
VGGSGQSLIGTVTLEVARLEMAPQQAAVAFI